MRTLKLTLAYDGTAYAGWQRQPDAPTIQQFLENALAEIEGEPVTTHAAGRTDAGVHALGQVASVRLRHPLELQTLTQALNAKLPSDVRVLRTETVPDAFHARYDARAKTYRYRFAIGRVANPFESRYLWSLPRPVDLDAMRAACARLRGRHDFAAFQTAAGEDAPATTIRTILDLSILEDRSPSWLETAREPASDVVVLEVTGDGFLRHMVRAMVGTLVDVGVGRRAVGDITHVLESRRRDEAGPTAPACGLFLVRVDYP